MKEDFKQFLEKYKTMYATYKQVGVIPHLSYTDAKTFLSIAQYFDPRYTQSLWCNSCVMSMIDFVYQKAEREAMPVMQMNFPKQDKE